MNVNPFRRAPSPATPATPTAPGITAGARTYRCPSPGCEYVLDARPTGQTAGKFAIVLGPKGETYAQCPLDGSALA